MAIPFGDLTFKEVLEIGLVPQDHDSIMKEALRREFKKAEDKHIEFMASLKHKNAGRIARAEIQADLYVEAAVILASSQGFADLRSTVAALKGGFYGNKAGDVCSVLW